MVQLNKLDERRSGNPDSLPSPAVSKTISGITGTFQDLRVLAVVSDPVAAARLRKAFETEGFNRALIVDLSAGFKLIHQHIALQAYSPQIILLDVSPEAAAQLERCIRDNPVFSPLPVGIITDTVKHSLIRLLSFTALNKIMVKPFLIGEFKNWITIPGVYKPKAIVTPSRF